MNYIIYNLVKKIIKFHPNIGKVAGLIKKIIYFNEKNKIKNIDISLMDKIPVNYSNAQLIQILFNAGAINKRNIHKWITKLYVDRRINEIEEILELKIVELSNLFLYHSIRISHYKGKPYPSDTLVLNLLEKATSLPYLYKQILNQAVQQLCMTNNVKSIKHIINKLNVKILFLNKNSIMGVVRIFIKNDNNDDAVLLLNKYLIDAAETEKLYFIEPIQFLKKKKYKLDFNCPLNWRETLKLLEISQENMEFENRNEFKSFFIDPLAAVPENNDFMDIRINYEKRREIKKIITMNLEKRKPLSLIRLGDGEAYTFPSPLIESAPSGSFEQDNLVREIHWWGASPNESTRNEIKIRTLAAISDADILGIPSVYRIIRDYGGLGSSVGSDRSRRGLAIVLHAVLNIIPFSASRVFTEERCHQVIFDEIYLAELCSIAKKVVVVSCWNKEQMNIQFLDNAEFILIPPHTKVRDCKEDIPPLFKVYKDLEQSVISAVEPGTLLILGAGLIGKILIKTAKDNGAVALDVGSVLDYWVGRKTRSLSDII